MFRNLLVAALIGPPVGALTIIVLLLPWASSSIYEHAQPAMLVYMIFGAYFFGIVPALLAGMGNNIAERFIASRRVQMLIALPIGAAATAAVLVGIPAIGGLLGMRPPILLFCAGGAMAALVSAWLAGSLRHKPVAPAP
jgi:hypothetical protein